MTRAWTNKQTPKGKLRVKTQTMYSVWKAKTMGEKGHVGGGVPGHIQA